MSHEPTRANCPTDAELFAAKNRPGSLIDQIAAANAIRDKRIRNEALEEVETIIQKQWEQAHCLTDGHDIAGQQLLRGLALAVGTIRALKDKEPNHE